MKRINVTTLRLSDHEDGLLKRTAEFIGVSQADALRMGLRLLAQARRVK